MTRNAEQRRRASRISLIAWYTMIAPALGLSGAAAYEAFKAGQPWQAILLVFVTILSTWAGIESAHARLNADLET